MTGRTFLDSDVLVYSVDESPAERHKHARAVRALAKLDVIGVEAPLVLAAADTPVRRGSRSGTP